MTLLTNGDFETGALSPWTHFDDTSGYAAITTDEYAGTYAVECVNGTGSNSQLKQDAISITSGNLYLLEFWIKASSSSTINVRLINDNSPFENYGLFEDVTTTTSYTFKSIQFTANTTSSDARLQFWVADALNSESIKIDEVSLTVFIPPWPRAGRSGIQTGLRHGVIR